MPARLFMEWRAFSHFIHPIGEEGMCLRELSRMTYLFHGGKDDSYMTLPPIESKQPQRRQTPEQMKAVFARMRGGA